MLRALELLGRTPPIPAGHMEGAGPGSCISSTPPAKARAHGARSPYFSPRRSARTSVRATAEVDADEAENTPEKAVRRSKRVKRNQLPPTPTSPPAEPAIPNSLFATPIRPPVTDALSGPPTPLSDVKPVKRKRTPVRQGKRAGKGKAQALVQAEADSIVAPNENGDVESVDKIHLIQERVRHDPWRMLVATCLLNVTSGRAARPIFIEIMRRWPTAEALAQASILDLTELLYPLGLFNQRASTLIRFSQQYLAYNWPLVPPPVDPDPEVCPTIPGPSTALPENLDVRVFHGAGIYASDSFRIYSDLFPGGGAPDKEDLWLAKGERALKRLRTARSGADDKSQGRSVLEVGERMSDEEEGAEEEWRRVIPKDKELRRYLIWRWGLEGIEYDILAGPRITLERDRRRLKYLLDPENDEDI